MFKDNKEESYTFEDHTSNFFANLKTLKDSGSYCDTCLQVKNSLWFCHGIVLAASSNVLHSLINSNRSNFEKILIVKLPDCFDSTAMELMLDFFYSQKLNINQETAADLLAIAEYLQLSSVVTECKKGISKINETSESLKPGTSTIGGVYDSGTLVSNGDMSKNKKDVHHANHSDFNHLTDVASRVYQSLENDISKSGSNKAASLKFGRNMHRCKDCLMVFTLKKDFTKHINEKHVIKKFSCSQCSKTFSRKADAELHKRRKHMLNKPFACERCDKTFSLLRELQVHERVHEHGYAYKCDVCSNTFKTHQGYLHHSKHAHVQARFKCEREGCSMTFVTESKRNEHCLSCGRAPTSQFECDECGRLFSRRHLLQRHHRSVHLKLKPFECDVCSRRFTREEQLRQHAPSHTGRKDYECNECGKRFRQKSSLSVHKRQHSDSSQVVCDVCGYRCHSTAVLRRHQRTHSSEKRHVCDVCAKPFKTLQTLKRHMILHETSANVPRNPCLTTQVPIASCTFSTALDNLPAPPASPPPAPSPQLTSPTESTLVCASSAEVDSINIAYTPIRLVDDVTMETLLGDGDVTSLTDYTTAGFCTSGEFLSRINLDDSSSDNL